MGMYSTHYEDQIKVLNKLALEKIRDSGDHDLYNLIDDYGDINFDAWCGHKLEGYWYEETIEILKELAPFINGYTEFKYEEGYGFRIIFKDGNVYIKIEPEADWDNIKAKKL